MKLKIKIALKMLWCETQLFLMLLGLNVILSMITGKPFTLSYTIFEFLLINYIIKMIDDFKNIMK